MRLAVVQQNGHLHAVRARLLQVDACEVGDGVGGVGAMPYVRHGPDAILEGWHAPPISEGLFGDHMTAVLKESGSEFQALSSLELDVSDPANEISNKTLLLSMVVFGAF